MKKKKIWYGVALCAFALVLTFLLPIGLDTATDTFVDWITSKEPESESETESEELTEHETKTQTEQFTESETELQSETESESETSSELQREKDLPLQTDAASVEYETDPPIPIEPEGGWQGNEDMMYEGTGADAAHGSTGGTNGTLSGDTQAPAQSETPTQEELEEDDRFDKGLEQAREAMKDLEYSETEKGGIDRFIGGREEQFARAVADYVYSKYEGFVEAESVNIISFVEESEAELTYQIEIFATDGNSELFLCTYQKQIDAYGIYPLKDVTNREE